MADQCDWFHFGIHHQPDCTGGWTTNATAPVIVNTNNAVTNGITGTQKFYRLSQ